jgi:BirA family biotin operon repressor/biotin-[acetyl-CoA-carboxylase] ligase
MMIGREIRRFGMVSSTNDLAKHAGEEGEDEGLVVVAESQANGRGRRGRKWISRPGLGVYFSALLRPTWPQADAPRLAMVAGVAAAEAVESFGVKGVSIKWPNDVLIRGRKVAGVLVEPRLAHGRVEFAVVGIGINVGHAKSDFTDDLKSTATSLRIEGAKATCEDVVQRLIGALHRWYEADRDELQAVWSAKGGAPTAPEL